MSWFSTDKISEKEYNKALKVIEAYEKQKEECCCHRSCHCCHSCKPIKKGCLVKYTSKAHEQIGSSVDTKIHRVEKVVKRDDAGDLIYLCNGHASDRVWLEHA